MSDLLEQMKSACEFARDDQSSEAGKRGVAPAGDPRTAGRSPRELVDEAVDRAAAGRRFHRALGLPSDRRISNEVIDKLLAGASTEEEIAGPGGLLAELTKRPVERALEVELTDHVGYEPPDGATNQRNGTTPKTPITDHGKVKIDAPATVTAALSRRSSKAPAPLPRVRREDPRALQPRPVGP